MRALVQELERTGKDALPLLDRAGIERELLEQPYARLDTDRYDELQRLAMDASFDPALGLTMGEHASLASFGLVGHMAMHCRTLRDAFHLWVKYFEVAASVEPPDLIEEGDRSRLVYRYVRSSDLRCDRLRAEFGVTTLMVAIRAILGEEARATEVWFEHPAPAYAERYERPEFGIVRFDQPATSICFRRALLDVRLRHHDDQVLGILTAQADRVLADLREDGGIAGKMRRTIVEAFPDVPATADDVGKRLGMSGRSLRRRLEREGLGFQKVLGEAMGELACRLLRDPDATLQQVAYQLGFSEPSAFHRAFKRWTGMTPTEWRRTEGR